MYPSLYPLYVRASPVSLVSLPCMYPLYVRASYPFPYLFIPSLYPFKERILIRSTSSMEEIQGRDKKIREGIRSSYIQGIHTGRDTGEALTYKGYYVFFLFAYIYFLFEKRYKEGIQGIRVKLLHTRDTDCFNIFSKIFNIIVIVFLFSTTFLSF